MQVGLTEQIGEKLILLDKYTRSKNTKKTREISQDLENIRSRLIKDKTKGKEKDSEDIRNLSRYPEYDDDEFQAKIFKKNEFFKSKYPKTNTSLGYEALVDKECNHKSSDNKQLKLSRNQMFLKNFMSKQTPYKNILLFHGVGVGKCHLKDTPIISYDGSIMLVQNIRVGDRLMGDDSTPRTVTSLAHGYDTMYKIIYEDDRNFVVNGEHVLVLFFAFSSIFTTFKSNDSNDSNDSKVIYSVIHVDHKQRSLVEVKFDDEKGAKIYESWIYEQCSYDENFIHVTVEDYTRLSDKIKGCLSLRRSVISHFDNSESFQNFERKRIDGHFHKLIYNYGKQVGGSILHEESENTDDNDDTSSKLPITFSFTFPFLSSSLTNNDNGSKLDWQVTTDIRYGSKATRQAFLAGFLNALRTSGGGRMTGMGGGGEMGSKSEESDEISWFPYDEVIESIALYTGLKVLRKSDYNKGKTKWVQFMALSIPVPKSRGRMGRMRKNIKDSPFDKAFAIWELYTGTFKPDFESSCIRFDVQKLQYPDHYYGFTLDGNNRYLLGDAIITHNTCSAISIAEQYHTYYKNPVTVLMPRNLKDNFIKQIFDPETMGGCASSKYLSMIPKHATLPKAKIQAMVNQLINTRYKFSGFTEFANEIEKIEDKYKARYPNPTDKDLKNSEIYNEIKQLYSNRVFVIDEVHNIRSEENEKKGLEKRATRRIIQVPQAADNVKLVLLSATPMYNGTKEIVGIFNIMLANDKQNLLENKDIFSDNGKLTSAGESKLIQLSRSYVSFMRGNNPFTFPFQLYPLINKDPDVMKKSEIPTRSIMGAPLHPKDRLDTIIDKLVINRLSRRQEKVYNQLKPKWSEDRKNGAKFNDSFGEGSEVNEIEEQEQEQEGSREQNKMSKLVQTSILTYPTSSPETSQGEKGFNLCFRKVSAAQKGRELVNAKVQFEYKPGMEGFLSYDEVGKHSSKIKSIIDYIDKSEGIVFIYSRFLYASLIPLAIALEHIGFIKSDNTTLLAKPSPMRNPQHKIKVTLGDENQKNQAKIQPRYTPKYSLLTGNTIFSSDIAREVSLINNANNANGEEIKVILGTAVSAEGIDFKNIRQVHIVEPWYHLNKLNQVIGRAVRNCSHYNLPPHKRNVTIYQHASIDPSDEKTESIDLWLYGMSERKQKEIDKVERIMATNAIDCALNQNRLFYPASEMNVTLPSITTSQGVIIPNYMVGDRRGSKFNGMKCSVTEKFPELENINDSELDFKTYNKDFYEDDIITYKGVIKNFVQEAYDNGVFSFDRLVERIKAKDEFIDSDVLKFALESMLNKKDMVMNKNGETGHLVYFSDKYMFQPKIAPEAYFSKRQRKGMYSKSINKIVIDEKLIRSKRSDKPGILLDAQKRKEFEKLVQKQNFPKKKMNDDRDDKELIEIDEAKIAKQLYDEEMKRLALENQNIIDKVQTRATELLREYFSHIIDKSEDLIPFLKRTLKSRPIMKIASQKANTSSKSSTTPTSFTTYLSSFGVLCLIQSAYDFVIDREMSEHVSALLEDIIEQIQVEKPQQPQQPKTSKESKNPISTLTEFMTAIENRFIQHKNKNSSEADQETMSIIDTVDLSMLLCARSLMNGRYIYLLSQKENKEKKTRDPIVFFRNPTFLTEKYGYQAIRNHAGLKSKVNNQITNGQALLILKKDNENDYVLKDTNSFEILLFSENARHAFDYMTDKDKLFHLKGTFSQWGKTKYNEFKHINELKKKGVLCGTGVISDIPYLTDLVTQSDFKKVSKPRYVKNDLCIMYEMVLRYKTHLTGHLYFLRPVEKFVYDLRAIELDINNPLRRSEDE